MWDLTCNDLDLSQVLTIPAKVHIGFDGSSMPFTTALIGYHCNSKRIPRILTAIAPILKVIARVSGVIPRIPKGNPQRSHDVQALLDVMSPLFTSFHNSH